MAQQPDCAMFNWGYAMSLFHPLWPDKIEKEALLRGQNALAATKELKVSARERAYLSAAGQYYKNWENVGEPLRIKAWAEAHKAIYETYPDDADAKAFWGLAQLVTASKIDKTFAQNKKAGEMLATLLQTNPLHPGAIHYSIHAYDNPVLAELGAEPARVYDKIAPDVPHALHMPTHIFVRLGAWEDAIIWNARSAKAALKYPSKGVTSMHYVHALDYLVYGQLQLGEGLKALKAYRDIEPHLPVQNTFPAAYALTTIPARISLEQQKWEQASQLEARNPAYINWDKFPQVEAITYFSRGVGAARSGNLSAAKADLAMLDQLQKKTQTLSPNYWAILVDAQRKAVKAWILYAEGNKTDALALLRKAADIEDSLDKDPVTPGAVLPARDLLGDMLLYMGDKAGAEAAYSASLAIGPNRLYSRRGIHAATLVDVIPGN
jgi:tetratricopeptide (TPR) repeat protein